MPAEPCRCASDVPAASSSPSCPEGLSGVDLECTPESMIWTDEHKSITTDREDTVMRKIRWGVLGTADIAKGQTIPGMMLAEHCERYAIAGRRIEKAKSIITGTTII